MAWIESHTVLLRHRKLLPLARELRLKPVYTMGHLHALWHAALEQQDDGDLSGWSDEMIADYSCYHGDAPQYVRLLQQYGWLDGKLLHDWLDYASGYLVARYHSSNRNRLCAIWKKHGYRYGSSGGKRKQLGITKEPLSQLNQPLPTNLNQPKKDPPISPPTTGRFAVPNAAEVTAYAKTIGFDLDGRQFCDYYEAKGWRIGTSPMKSWRAAVRTWKTRSAHDRAGSLDLRRGASDVPRRAPNGTDGTDSERAERHRQLDALTETVAG